MPGKKFETQFRGVAVNNAWETDTKKDYCTPPKYIAAILRVFPRIDLDPCSNNLSLVPAKARWILPDVDGLHTHWPVGHIFVNPPYGRDAQRKTTIADWTARCVEAANRGAEVMALIPVATNTSHWKKYVFKATSVCFLADTRLRFYSEGQELPTGAPMACAVPYWGTKYSNTFTRVFSEFGQVMQAASIRKQPLTDNTPSMTPLFGRNRT
jgi:hypothetical protein